MNWLQLNDDDKKAFLSAVGDKNEWVVFEPTICDVHTVDLPFYIGFDLVRIVNKNMIPYMVLDYLSNGQDHYYLDGSDNAFQTANAMGALDLNHHNVVSYFDMYVSYVYERGNSLEPTDALRDPNITVSYHDEVHSFTAPLQFRGAITQADIRVQDNGAIHITAPLQVSFMETLTPDIERPRRYRHPHETQILDQAKALMAETDIGRELLGYATDKNLDLRVFCSPNYQIFTTNQPVIYLLFPALEQNAKYLQALYILGGIRCAQQILEGYPIPHPNNEPDLYLSVCMGKNLDFAVKMCKMVAELENKNILEAIEELKKIGLYMFYQAIKETSDPYSRAMQDIFDQSMRQHKMIFEV